MSIALVLVGHAYGTAGSPLPDLAPWLGDHASLGVLVFFTLSGFLITSLMLAEKERHGRVSLRAFYWRRTVRIFPPAYVYLLVLAVLGLASSGDLLVAAAYLSNMSIERPWVLGHLWSLAVEEQFYLLWPVTFVALGARAVWALVAVITLAPVARLVTFLILREPLPVFPAVADSLAFGCLLAVMRPQLHATWWYVRLRDMPVLALVLGIVVVNVARTRYFKLSYLGVSVLSALVALLIDRCVVHHKVGVGRFLNAAPVVWVGTLSYSLYLWQQVFLNRTAPAWYTTFPLNVLLAFAAAVASFWLVEVPVRRLRQWPRRTHTQSQPVAAAPSRATAPRLPESETIP